MYVMPSAPLRFSGRRVRRLSGLGLILARTGDGFDVVPIDNRRRLPGPPRFAFPPAPQPQPPVAVVPTTTTTVTPSGAPQTGNCVVQSSPETGGVTSVVPCANVGPNRGGTIAPVNPAAPQLPQTPVPSNYPTTQPFYASDGSVWNYNSVSAQWMQTQAPGYAQRIFAAPLYSPVPAGYPTNQAYFAVDGSVWSYSSSSGQWMETEPPGSSQNPSSGYISTLASPVPAGYPTTQPYFSTDGSVWNYNSTIARWVETQLPGSAAAALLNQQASGTPVTSAAPVTVQTGASSYQSVIDWFSQDTIISGIKNVWILGAGFLAYTFLKNKGRR